jgi:hypothetical protein
MDLVSIDAPSTLLHLIIDTRTSRCSGGQGNIDWHLAVGTCSKLQRA